MRSLAIAPTVVPPDCIEICGERAILRTSRHPKRAHLVLLRNIRQVPEMGARFSLDQDTAKHTSKRHELRTSQRAGPAPGIPGRGFAPTRACLPARIPAPGAASFHWMQRWPTSSMNEPRVQ